MFRIKICGVTNADDARAAIGAGADALGINFYPSSKRFVDRNIAMQIGEVVPSDATKVGVFVNHSASEIRNVVESLRPAYIQLHGDEPATLLPELPAALKIIRAFRCGSAGLAPLASYLDRCRANGRMPDAVLIDSDAAGAFGGTGRAADWSLITRDRTMLGDIPLILAGGLTPANVVSAIEAVRPNAVDVASGVERQTGQKDHDLIEQFIIAARSAFDRI